MRQRWVLGAQLCNTAAVDDTSVGYGPRPQRVPFFFGLVCTQTMLFREEAPADDGMNAICADQYVTLHGRAIFEGEIDGRVRFDVRREPVAEVDLDARGHMR